jgi:hypothetical protein
MATTVTYGFGGYDETKPNNNLVSIETFDDETGELLEVETF